MVTFVQRKHINTPPVKRIPGPESLERPKKNQPTGSTQHAGNKKVGQDFLFRGRRRCPHFLLSVQHLIRPTSCSSDSSSGSKPPTAHRFQYVVGYPLQRRKRAELTSLLSPGQPLGIFSHQLFLAGLRFLVVFVLSFFFLRFFRRRLRGQEMETKPFALPSTDWIWPFLTFHSDFLDGKYSRDVAFFMVIFSLFNLYHNDLRNYKRPLLSPEWLP